MTHAAERQPLGASFRDPSGFVFAADGVLYRQVNRIYQPHYDQLIASGLYEALVGRHWLVRHVEEPPGVRGGAEAYRILKPEPIPYVSYPYEWCFSQLQDAALLTLDIQLLALSYGMSLKDASAYNVQFVGYRPVFIDTLSFERYEERPWVAYRQFCQYFLAPLALMSHVDTRLGQLLRVHIDGIPLDLASRLLPAATRLRPALLLHIHAHARSQTHYRLKGAKVPRVAESKLPKGRLLALLENLRGAVRRCRPPDRPTEWSDYYDDTNYSAGAMAKKESAVVRMVDAFAKPGELVHDLGANTGRFSRLLAGPGRYVVAHDVDALAVERNYRLAQSERHGNLLPLLLDVTNPSPAIGWALDERASALERLSRGTVVALALIHHLAISNNVPLAQLARFFARLSNTLVIEFVPKEDSQARRLLATRPDVFPDYNREAFEAAFAAHFELLAAEEIPGSARTLFAMRRRS